MMLNHTIVSKYQENGVKYADFDYLERFSGKFYIGKHLDIIVFNCFGSQIWDYKTSGFEYPMYVG